MPTTHLQTRPLAGEQMLLCLKEAEIRVLSTLDLQDNIIRHAASCNKKPYSDLNLKARQTLTLQCRGAFYMPIFMRVVNRMHYLMQKK